MKLNFLESFHQLECVFTGFSFLFQKQSNNWLKNRKNSEFVVSEMVVGFGEQDSRT